MFVTKIDKNCITMTKSPVPASLSSTAGCSLLVMTPGRFRISKG